MRLIPTVPNITALIPLTALLLSGLTLACDVTDDEAELAEARAHGERAAREFIEAHPAERSDASQDPPPAADPTTNLKMSTDDDDALDPALIRRVVAAHISEIRHCYNEGLQRDPELAGRIAVQFTITGQGQVTDATASESELSDPAVDACIVAAVGRWLFPRPRGDVAVVVTYPFLLSPG